MSGQSQSSTIPTSFTERYIWKPEPTVESTSTIWSFEGDMLSDIQWGISYAFQCASDATTGIGKTVTLLSPYHSGNAVLDAVLRVIAHEQNADILVLDSLELVAGPFGALGKGNSVQSAVVVGSVLNRLSLSR
ncbi:hypothetical protein L218DRAFT_884723 [Marasmius fiardii PR-910]|nr:hypothetical protein L218DRAFT_884723 [Marasmius fiardii PR-910]